MTDAGRVGGASRASRRAALDLELSAPEWRVDRRCYLAGEDALYESLFHLSNGRVGVRATVDFAAGGGEPGCFYRTLYGPGLDVPSELVNALNFSYWRGLLGRQPLALREGSRFPFFQSLDLRRAAVATRIELRDPRGRNMEVSTYAALPAPHPDLELGVLDVHNLNGASAMALELGIDWRRANAFGGGSGPALRLNHLWVTHVAVESGRIEVCAHNRATEQHVAVVTAVLRDSGVCTPVVRDGQAVVRIHFGGSAAGRHRVVRVSSFGVSDDPRELLVRCRTRLEQAVRAGVAALLSRHREVWQSRWRSAGVELEGPRSDVEGLRYAVFQLLQAPDRAAGDANIPARGLSSPHHAGHYFFNTELYLAPCYAATEPAVARGLIEHRATRLNAARDHARASGYAGARFPVESDESGRDAQVLGSVEPFDPRSRHKAIRLRAMHISADVLYALHRYLSATGDFDVLRGASFDVAIEVARHYADLLRVDPAVGARGARAVTCFDELHPRVSHHYATNYLGAWSLRWVAKLVDSVGTPGSHPALRQARGRLSALGLTRDEVRAWRDIAADVYLPRWNGSPALPQFQGYDALPDERVRGAAGAALPEPTPRQRAALRGGRGSGTRLIKQADCVLLLALFPDHFSDETAEATFDLYAPRTLHASSLSSAPHAAVAARLGRTGAALGHLRAALRYNLDFQPRHGYRNGVHFASYAGAWLALLEGFVGWRPAPGGARLAPRLPDGWDSLRLGLVWRGHSLELLTSPRGTSVTRRTGADTELCLSVGKTRRSIGPRSPVAHFPTLSDR